MVLYLESVWLQDLPCYGLDAELKAKAQVFQRDWVDEGLSSWLIHLMKIFLQQLRFFTK